MYKSTGSPVSKSLWLFMVLMLVYTDNEFFFSLMFICDIKVYGLTVFCDKAQTGKKLQSV